MIPEIKNKIPGIKTETQNRCNQCNFSGQGLIEYFIIMTLILTVILSSGFMERVRGGFEVYFNTAVEKLR